MLDTQPPAGTIVLSHEVNDAGVVLLVAANAIEFIRELHRHYFESDMQSVFDGSVVVEHTIETREPWWMTRRQELLELGSHDSPLYVYGTHERFAPYS